MLAVPERSRTNTAVASFTIWEFGVTVARWPSNPLAEVQILQLLPKLIITSNKRAGCITMVILNGILKDTSTVISIALGVISLISVFYAL